MDFCRKAGVSPRTGLGLMSGEPPPPPTHCGHGKLDHLGLRAGRRGGGGCLGFQADQVSGESTSKIPSWPNLRRGWGPRAEILLPSAVHLEERLTVSQSVPEPASRQSDRYTQFGFFVSARCGPKQHNPSSGRVVTQPAGIRVVGGSNPRLPTLAPPSAAALKVSRAGFEPTPAHLVSAALPLDRWPCYQHRASPLLVAY